MGWLNKFLLLWVAALSMGNPQRAWADCQIDSECSNGMLCQCQRRFIEGTEQCDEMGGQCAAPTSPEQVQFRAKAHARAEQMRSRLLQAIPTQTNSSGGNTN